MGLTDAEVDRLRAAAQNLRRGLVSRNTLMGYGYDWAMFARWCTAADLTPLPAESETVRLYLTDLLEAGKKITTVSRRQCAIAWEHRARGFPSPITADIRALLVGAQRLRHERPRQMRPLTVEQLRAISRELARVGTDKAMRDRAMLVLGYASALRRSSLAALTTEDIEFVSEGVIVEVRSEKQDQAGRGRVIGLPRGRNPHTCPERTLAAWLRRRGRAYGPLFWRLDPGHEGLPMQGQQIMRLVKTAAARIGLDPSHYGAHSLRAGFVTAAGEAGAGEFLIAAQTGHRSMSVLRTYFRRVELFRANASSLIGL